MTTSRSSVSVTAAHAVRPESPILLPTRRLHRRGCRSAAAVLRRADAWRERLVSCAERSHGSETKSDKNPVFRSGHSPDRPEKDSPGIPISGQASATNSGRSALLRGAVPRDEGSLRGCRSFLVESSANETVGSEPPNGEGSSDSSTFLEGLVRPDRRRSR